MRKKRTYGFKPKQIEPTDPTIWKFEGKRKQETVVSEPDPNPPSQEFAAKVAANSWHDREEFGSFVETIKDLSREPEYTDKGEYAEGSNRWSWAKNWRCKYIDLRIDMRDGGFIMLASGERISLDQLKYQWKGN